MNNDPQESTTKHGTTIDAVFSKYLHNLKSRTFITYFSYHKPLVSHFNDALQDEGNIDITDIEI